MAEPLWLSFPPSGSSVILGFADPIANTQLQGTHSAGVQNRLACENLRFSSSITLHLVNGAR